jgi:T-complex protein 1 subunit gamma
MSNRPVFVMNQNSKRETGREAQLGNILAAKTVADIVRTTLGPRSMLKMLLDPMGGIVLTNDGNAILREVDVSHPAAKSMIELSRAQDEEVGDGTTSVIILAGEILTLAAPLIEKAIHPTVIVRGFYRALEEALAIAARVATEVSPDDAAVVKELIAATVGTKISSRYGELMVNIAIKAVKTVMTVENGKTDIDIKRYAKVEKIPGGDLTECRVVDGVMLNKDIVHSKMRRRIEKPRILLLDCPLEYKKSESQMNYEITDDQDWNKLLKQEEDYIKNLCTNIIAFKPDVVFTEKGLSDLAQHFFVKAGISAIRRIRKTDANRIARATGATIVSRTEEISEEDIGTRCGLFDIRKIGDEYFTFLEQCEDPKACSIILRGASKVRESE